MTQNNLETFSCDLCKNSEAVEIPHVRNYTKGQPIHICKNCGFVYVTQRRSTEEIAKMWSEELFGDHYTARIPAVVARQTYVADFIDMNIGLKNKEVCDIGAGEGQFLNIIRKQYGAKPFGTEASQSNCHLLKDMDIAYFQGTIEDYASSSTKKNYQADIITMMWTLENCRSCTDMLKIAFEIVKPNGYVVAATGSRLLVPFKKPLHLYFSQKPVDIHSFRFSRNTLQGLLSISGFQVTHENHYLDSDVLCLIAQKKEKGTKIPWKGDDFLKVYDFFDRWHKESIFYR